MANSMANLLDLPHALLEHISTKLTLPGVGRYASVCSLLRQLIAANTAPCWRIHLQACTGNVASDEPRLALRALTTLDAARWADISPRFAESEDPDAHIARLDFDEGQPTSQVAHAAFTCNDGKTLVIVGVKRHSIVLTAWAIDTTTPAARWQEAPCSEQARGMGVLERSRLRIPLQKPYNLAPNPTLNPSPDPNPNPSPNPSRASPPRAASVRTAAAAACSATGRGVSGSASSAGSSSMAWGGPTTVTTRPGCW